MAEAQDRGTASSVKSHVSRSSLRSNRMLSDADSIDREIVLVRRERELLRSRRARDKVRTSASDGQAAKAPSGRLRHHSSRRLTSPESVSVHGRLDFGSVRSKRGGDVDIGHILPGKLDRDAAATGPQASMLPHLQSLPQPIVMSREHKSSTSSRQTDSDSSVSAANLSDVLEAEPKKGLGRSEYPFPAGLWSVDRAVPPKYGVRHHRDKAQIFERPLLTATEDRALFEQDILANRAASDNLYSLNANRNYQSSSVKAIPQTADVAVNTTSVLSVVDDSSGMAVAKSVVACNKGDESKSNADSYMKDDSNVCVQPNDDVKLNVAKSVLSVAVKSEPPAVADVETKDVVKDVVKSEKDLKGSEKVESNKSSGKGSRKKKGHRARSSSSESEGEKPSKHSLIRLPKYDGMSVPFLTFKAQFNNAAAYNKWSESDQLAQLKACLTSTAANVMWDSDPSSVEDLPKLWQTLADRFGGHDLTEKYRTELRARARKPNESLNSLYADIKKLSAMGYPGPTSAAKEAIMRDCFIEALDPALALKLREKEVANLDQALSSALKLEAIQTAVTSRDKQAESYRNDKSRDKFVRNVGTSSRNDKSDASLLSKLDKRLDEMQSEFKALHNFVMSNKQQQNTVPPPAQSVNPPAPPASQQRASMGQANSPPVGARPEAGSQPSFSNNGPPPALAQRRRGCYICHDTGHFARSCPLNNRNNQPFHNTDAPPRPDEFNRQAGRSAAPAADVFVTRGAGSNLKDEYVYIDIVIDGKSHLALVDTGCQLSLIPPSLIGDRPLQPSPQKLYAANYSPIHVRGTVELPVTIAGCNSVVKMLVTPDVREPMLSFAWLSENKVCWDFTRNALFMHGRLIPLQKKKCPQACRRVYLCDDVVVPPRSQVNVPARSTLDVVTVSRGDNWLLEAKQIHPGVLAASTLLPDRHHDISVRVVNTTTEPQALRGNMCLGDLSRVDVSAETIQPVHEPVQAQSTSSASTATEVIDPIPELMQTLPEELTEPQRQAIKQLFERYEDVMSKSDLDVGETHLIQHRIPTGDHPPIRQPLRRHPTAYNEAIDEHIGELLQHGILEPCQGPWASNIVIVRHKNGKIRCCCDYRGINVCTYNDSYPLPNIEATVEALNGAAWFCSVDLRAGYHNIPVAEEDRDKTAIITRRGLFRFRKMPFGLSSAPGTFQRLMDLVFSGLNYYSVLVYLDDVVVFGPSVETLMERLEEVFLRLRGANLKINTRKCHLFQRRISFLGHVISQDGVEVQPEKTAAVEEWPVPCNIRELRSFLGLASYYRKFIRSFSLIAEPLYELLRKGRQFCWSETQQLAFEQLKSCLVQAPVLGTPQANGCFYLDTDASDRGLGIVLSQMQGGVERVIAYASRTLTQQERAYCVTRKELLAVVYGLKKFRPYLMGRHFVVRTDHSAIQWLRKTPMPLAQTARWLLFIEQYDFEVQHRSGVKHGNADALSRRPHVCKQCETIVPAEAKDNEFEPTDNDPVDGMETCPKVRVVNQTESSPFPDTQTVHSMEELADLQAKDPELAPIIRLRLQQSDQPSFDVVRSESAETKFYWSQWARLIVREGVVFRIIFDRQGRPCGQQLLVPKALRNELIEMVHAGLTGCHVGVGKTIFQVGRRAWWKGWKADVRRFYQRCPRCSRYFRGRLPRQGTLQPTRVGAIMERLSIDLTGPHPRSKHGNVYICTVIDVFSKWLEIFAIRNKEALTVAKVLVEKVFCRLGTPLSILSDRGGEVDSQLMHEICQLLHIDKLHTSSYHPACNAQIERQHRTLNTILGKVVSEHQSDWDEMLNYVAAALRASPSESTGYSANFLMLGREVNTPADIVYGVVEPQADPNYDDFVETVRDRMCEAYNIARENLQVAANRNKRYYDMRVKQKSFQVGESVYYYNPRRFKGRSDKWARKYTGPFVVEKVLSQVTYLLRRSPRSKPFVSHVDKLRKCYEIEPEPAHPVAADEPVVLSPPPLPGREDTAQSLEVCEESNRSDDERVARPKRQTRAPKRFIEQY